MEIEDIKIPKSIHCTLSPEHREALKYICDVHKKIYNSKEGLSGVIRNIIESEYHELGIKRDWPTLDKLVSETQEGEEE